jgi:hypothetical protein
MARAMKRGHLPPQWAFHRRVAHIRQHQFVQRLKVPLA